MVSLLIPNNCNVNSVASQPLKLLQYPIRQSLSNLLLKGSSKASLILSTVDTVSNLDEFIITMDTFEK